MLLRKFYKFIKFKTVSKMFAANSLYVGPDSTRLAKFECGFQHWTIMSSNPSQVNALASLAHAMVKKQCFNNIASFFGISVFVACTHPLFVLPFDPILHHRLFFPTEISVRREWMLCTLELSEYWSHGNVKVTDVTSAALSLHLVCRFVHGMFILTIGNHNGIFPVHYFSEMLRVKPCLDIGPVSGWAWKVHLNHPESHQFDIVNGLE